MLILNRFFPEKATLSFGPLCFGAAQTMLFTLLPLLQEKSSLSISTLIIGLSLGTLCFLPGTFFWNKLSDEGKSRIALLCNSASLSFSVFTLWILIQFSLPEVFTLIIFLMGRLIWGLGASGIIGLTLHHQMKSERKKVKAVTTNSLALNLGRLLGTTIVLLPLEIEKALFGFFIITVFYLCLQIRVKNIEAIPQIHYSFLGHSKALMPALTLSFLIALITGLIHAGLASFIQGKFLLEGAETGKLTGLLLMTGSIVMIAGLIIGKSLQDTNWKSFIMSGMVLMCSGLFLIHWTNTRESLFISISLICLGISFIHPGSLLLMNGLTTESEKGKSLGLMSLTGTLGSAVGGILLSLSPDQFSNFANGLALVLSLGSFTILNRHDKEEVLWKA